MPGAERRQARLAWMLVAPAVAAVALTGLVLFTWWPGGVALGLTNTESVRAEADVLLARVRGARPEARLDGFLVQQMVAPDAAGVLFTVNPVSGAIDELVIEAALGLGDKVVSAQVTPDRFRVKRRKPHTLIEREGEETVGVLTPVLGEIADLGLACERLLGRAADVEWAVAGGRED